MGNLAVGIESSRTINVISCKGNSRCWAGQAELSHFNKPIYDVSHYLREIDRHFYVAFYFFLRFQNCNISWSIGAKVRTFQHVENGFSRHH